MGIADTIENAMGKLFINFRGRDEKLFTRGPAFIHYPEPTFFMESPDCGPTGSALKREHTGVGEERFPELTWTGVPTEAREYLLICEDPDAPLPTPITHGLYYSIPSHTTKVTARDFQYVDGAAKEKVLKSGFKVGKNMKGNNYLGPKPPLGHGPHRYQYQLIALSQPVDIKALSASATKNELAAAIVGKVVGWALWIGTVERKKE